AGDRIDTDLEFERGHGATTSPASRDSTRMTIVTDPWRWLAIRWKNRVSLIIGPQPFSSQPIGRGRKALREPSYTWLPEYRERLRLPRRIAVDPGPDHPQVVVETNEAEATAERKNVKKGNPPAACRLDCHPAQSRPLRPGTWEKTANRQLEYDCATMNGAAEGWRCCASVRRPARE